MLVAARTCTATFGVTRAPVWLPVTTHTRPTPPKLPVQAISLPMFAVLRRFSILFTMVLEARMLGNSFKFGVKLSVFLMLVGAIVAAFSDLVSLPKSNTRFWTVVCSRNALAVTCPRWC